MQGDVTFNLVDVKVCESLGGRGTPGLARVGEGLSGEWVRRKHKCEVSPFLVLVAGFACIPPEHMSFSTYARIFCGEGCG